MISKLMKMKTAFGQHLANRKDRQTKTSILPTVLTAQASVLRYCFFEGYETKSPEGYEATIALARVTESEALCRRLEKAGWTIHYHSAEMNIHSAVLEAISIDFAPGVNVNHVGCISEKGIRTLSEAGFSITAHAIPDENTKNRHFHPISDVLPSREVIF